MSMPREHCSSAPDLPLEFYKNSILIRWLDRHDRNVFRTHRHYNTRLVPSPRDIQLRPRILRRCNVVRLWRLLQNASTHGQQLHRRSSTLQPPRQSLRDFRIRGRLGESLQWIRQPYRSRSNRLEVLACVGFCSGEQLHYHLLLLPRDEELGAGRSVESF